MNEGSTLPPGRVVQVKAKKAPQQRIEKTKLEEAPVSKVAQDVLCEMLKKPVSYCFSDGRVKGALTITHYFVCFEVETETALVKRPDHQNREEPPQKFMCYVDMHDVLQCRYVLLDDKPYIQLFVSLRQSHPILVKTLFRLSKKSVNETRLTMEGVAEEALQLCKMILDSAETARNEPPQAKTHIPFYEEYYASDRTNLPNNELVKPQLSDAEGDEFSDSSDECPSEEGSAHMLPSLSKSDAPLFFGQMKAKVLSIRSEILTEKMYIAIRRELPKIIQLRNWKLVYSPIEHGCSLRTMYRNACDYGVTLLVVKDSQGTVFGGFVSEPWRVTKRYYGTGESFLFTFKGGSLRAYRPSLLNEYYIISDLQSIMFGAGVRSGLYVAGDLVRGSSGYCDTYGNGELGMTEDFKIVDLELWGFV